MNISVKYTAIKKMIDAKQNSSFIERIFGWHAIRTINGGEFDESYSASCNLGELDKKDSAELLKLLSKYDIPQKTISTVQLWIDNLSNPKNAVITSLQNLEKMLNQVLKQQSVKWLWKMNPDGHLLPFHVKEVKYRARNREDDACVCITLQYTNYKKDSYRFDDSDENLVMKSQAEHIYFYNSDIKEFEEEEFDFDFNENSSDDDDEDDDEKPAKKSGKKSKKGDYELVTILAKKDTYLMNQELFEKYKLQLTEMNKINKQLGKVYIAEGKGYVVEDSGNNYASWRNINVDDKISKLVVDVKKETISSSESPVHPYILTYNLSQYSYCCVHVDNMKEYSYDKDIISKLVMKENRKQLLSALISSENNFSDVVAGKSGGIIILASGGAGLGKTLTSEVYAELMGKPLYSVQSAQLGIKVEEIEKKLNKILYRAEKWNAVLLIDESDAYVSKRGDNIIQNAIVATFLRLLEYFNGVLFLTTNRADIIDDAIMSRVTAHIKYELPDYEETKELWKVLTKNFNFTIDEKTIKEIDDNYERLAGRDIRNFLKMLSKTSKTKKITLNSLEELSEFLPFLKPKIK